MDKTIFVFNKFYASLIKDLKKQEVLKNEIKKNYKAIDKLSKEHIDFLLTEFDRKFIDPDTSHNILKNISIDLALQNLESDKDKELFWNYYYILAVLALVVNEYEIAEDKEDESLNILSQSILDILGKKQKDQDVTDDIAIILHDDIQVLLPNIKHVTISTTPTIAEEPEKNPFGNMFPGMEKSQIASLAQEISKDIDISNLKIDSVDDISKLLDFSNSNNVMGDIIKRVSSSMQSKIANGELKQEDLFAEAMTMMSSMGNGGDSGLGGMAGLFNNPLVAEMMKNMGNKGKVRPNPEVFKKASSRDRLRKKLEERRKNEKP
jgi:hypothetical protein